MASLRTCKFCGSTFEADNGGRGQWPRFCSTACKETPKPKPSAGPCAAEGCVNPAQRRGLWCEKHYYRLRRRGTLNARPWHRRSVCGLEDCDEAEDIYGYCRLHGERFRRHGDPTVVLAPPVYRGEEHGSWLGDAAGYRAVHERLGSRQGKARDHRCVDCGAPAAHWSYDHSDPHEKQSEHGPFTHNLDAYSPRCVPCHKLLDLAHIQGARYAVVV